MKTWRSWLLPVDRKAASTVVVLVIELGIVPSWLRKTGRRSARARIILVLKVAWELKCDLCLLQVVDAR